MPPTPQVRLANRTLDLHQIKRSPQVYTRWFEQARAEDRHGLCLCSQPPLRLVIRHRQGRYHLAVWPGEGPDHHDQCPFHSEARPEHSGRHAYTDQAITDSPSGPRIRLAHALSNRNTRGDQDDGQARSGTGGTARSRVGLLGMLHYLWEATGLTHWRPGQQRRWETCQKRLRPLAARTTLNRLPLDQVLHVVEPFSRDRAESHETRFATWRSQLRRRRGLLLGELKGVHPTQHGVRVMLRHLRHPIFARRQLLDRVRRSHRSAFAEHPTARRVMLAVVEQTSRGHLVARDMAAMLTNAAYLPTDSTHEVTMADHLIDAGRTFYKPLRYETDSAVLPDFVLTDTDPPHACVEVLGMLDNPDYARHWHTKQQRYQALGAPVVAWDVGQPLPDLDAP